MQGHERIIGQNAAMILSRSLIDDCAHPARESLILN